MGASVSGDLLRELASAVPGGVSRSVSLATISRWRIGGTAAVIVEPSSNDEAASILRIMRDRPEPVAIIGETSNVLFSEDGFDGVLVKFGSRMSSVSIEGNYIRAQSGVQVPALVREATRSGLAGITHAAGVPGSLGGLVVMNGGTQRRGIGDHVARVTIADENGDLRTLSHDELGFAYRSSTLQGTRSAILEVELRLEDGDPTALTSEVDQILAERAAKFPLDLPNCGSTFLSDPSMYSIIGPPGRAIEEAGLKGLRQGGAQISERHANFVVNLGNASEDDVLWLIAEARARVAARTGFFMDCEVRHLSRTGTLRPAHEVAEARWGGASREERLNA